MAESRETSTLFAWIVIAVLLSAILAVSRTRVAILVGGLLAIPAIAVMLAGAGEHHRLGSARDSIVLLAFFGYVTFNLLSFILRRGDVDLDRISAAISVYLMMTICWALIYQ